MKQGVKGVGKSIIIAVALLAVASITSAQFARKARVKKTDVPALGTFYSLTLDQPPFPFNPFPELPVYVLTNGSYVYDDRTVDYAALRAEQSASLASAQSLSLMEAEGGGGMMMLMGGSGNTNLALSIPAVSGGMVTMSLLNAKSNESHDIFSTTTVGTTNAWLYRGRLAAGQTEASLSTSSSSSSTAYTAANSADTDGDTVPDGVETFSTQTDPNTPDSPENFPPGHQMVYFLTESNPVVRVKQFGEDYQAMTYFSFGTQDGFFGTNLWNQGIGGGGADFEVLQLFPPQTELLWEVAWDGAGNPAPSTFQRMPPGRWFYRRYLETGTAPLPNGHSQTDVYEVNTTTKIELLTGGRAFSTNQHLFVLNVQAADQDDVDPLSEPIAAVPASDITVLGEHPDSNGRVWKILADNQKVDVTPAVTSTHTNYDFTVDATKLKLKIMRNGHDIAGKKTVVWVGESNHLAIEVNTPGFTVSNVLWTIPGNTISNYVYNYTNGFVLPEYPKTNSAVAYHWVDGLERARVQVEGVIGGQPVNSETTFEIRRPSATFKLSPKWYVEITTNYAGWNPGDFPKLITGRMFTTNDVGMLYEYTLLDLKGYNHSCSFQFVQIATVDIKVNIAFSGEGYYSKEVQMRGLDGSYPYRQWFSPTGYGYADDSPSHLLPTDVYQFVYDHNAFECYLMFKPSNGIPVPLRVANWEWKGKALYNGAWVGVMPFVNPQGSIASDTLAFPTWTNNAASHRDFFRYNNFWFTP